ncbi:MAG: ABC transporter ATP-binding protein [Dongiaceae bacterium]
MPERVLTVEGLVTHFHLAEGVVRAVDGVDLTIDRNEILTVVGESGSGKSVTALSIMRLIQPPGRIEAGRIRLVDQELLSLDERAMRAVRGRRVSMIFQNPYASLHPYFRIGHQLRETLENRAGLRPAQAHRRSLELLERLQITAPDTILRKYPFEVSAGVCQRVMLALALVRSPDLLIADEPTTNLDAVAQNEILRLLAEMRDEYGMSILLITHDFGVVSMLADSVLVMYAGRPVEQGAAAVVLSRPHHPYTRGLIESAANLDRRSGRLVQIPGEIPDVMSLPPGCAFRARCLRATEQCGEDPAFRRMDDASLVRCWHPMGDGAGA